MPIRTLVIGGTGPTGPHVVAGLLERGHEVTICHTGAHEVDEIAPLVEHVHTDPFDGGALAGALGSRTFDLVVAMYGRLRAVAEVLAGRAGRFISVGGMPAYRGYMDPDRWSPPGLPVPTREDAPTSTDADDPKSLRVARTEELVLSLHPGATHLRYPYVYGPRQLVPREWPIVRRALDRRPFVIVPDGGLTLHTYGYAENLAHLLLLAVDHPEAAAGEVFNAGDETLVTVAQLVEHVAAALDHRFELVSMPWELAAPARPLIRQLRTTHKVVSVDKARYLLGYRDQVPVPEAIVRTARWLAANPPGPDVQAELEDPFDYDAEDELRRWWDEVRAGAPALRWARGEPGLTHGYQGPGTANPRADHRI